MKESPKIDLIDAICMDFHESIDNLADVLKKQRTDIEKLTAELANKKNIK